MKIIQSISMLVVSLELVHPYCSASVDSAFHPQWHGKMSISL